MWELDEEAGCTEVDFPIQGPIVGDRGASPMPKPVLFLPNH